MTLVLIGLPFFKSISQGWITYYKNSSGPKFTEEQVQMANSAAATLDNCYPIQDFIDPITHSEVCQSLRNEEFTRASRSLEMAPPQLNLNKSGCLEALKVGVWLLGTCSPESIRLATFNLLACDHFFPSV